jgi:hypothetical protein
MKEIFEHWRKYLAETAYPDLPSSGKYKVTMPLREIYEIFMKTIEKNLSKLQAVADDPEKLADTLTEIFEPEKLSIAFKVSKERFDMPGDGAFLHGGVSDPTAVSAGELPTVTMVLNKYTGEAIKKWDEPIEVAGGGFLSARKTTGKELMATGVRGTVVHEFVHQAQSQDAEISMGCTSPECEPLWTRLGELVGYDKERDGEDMGELMMPFIDRQTSQEFLDEKDKSEKDKEIRDIVNKVYYSSQDEFTGWAQGVPSDLIDAALRGRVPELDGLTGAELKQGVLKLIDGLIKNVDNGVPPEIAKENAALRFYGHPEGFIATYGPAGYKAFLQLAMGYADKYPVSMYK